MFWDAFNALCEAHKEKPTNVVKQLGMSTGCLAQWKSGATPSLKSAAKIAKHFNVRIEVLVPEDNAEKRSSTQRRSCPSKPTE